MATIPPALVIESSPMVPAGKIALMRRGNLVWFGNLSAPWDDVDCDRLLISPSDYLDFAEKVAGLGDGAR